MLKPGLLRLSALLLTAAAPLIQGDPIPSRDVILQGDPSSLTVSGTTDRSGGVLLSARPGRYALKLPNAQTLRVPAAARIEIGRTVLTTSTIQPGGRGDVWFLNREGRRLTFTVPRGARVRVVLTEGAPVGGGGSTRNMPVYNPDGSIVHPEYLAAPGGPSGPVRRLPDLPAQAGTGTNPEGRAGVRIDPRIPPPAGLRVSADVSTLRVSPDPAASPQSDPPPGDYDGDDRGEARTDPRTPPPAGLRISSDVATIRVQPGLAAAPPTMSPVQ